MRRLLMLPSAIVFFALPLSAHAQGQNYPRPSPSAHVVHQGGSTYLPARRYPRHNPTVKHYHHGGSIHSPGKVYPRPNPTAPQ